MKRKGFTLIELLVVVAIIAVLIAILLPALSQVRIKMKDMSCQLNLRQLGLAINMYADEWNEWLPPVRKDEWNQDINNAGWVPVLWPYVRSAIDATKRINDVKVGGVFVCPLDRTPIKEWGHMSSYFLWCGVPYDGRQRRCNSTRPDVTTIFRDLQVFWHVHDFDLASLPIVPYWPLFGMANFLYLDGHAAMSKEPPHAWHGWCWE